MVRGKILAVVSADEPVTLDADRRFRGAGIIRVLKQFRKHVTRALHLLEQLMPRPGELGIGVQLIPPLPGPIAYAVEIRRPATHPGTLAREMSSRKS